MDPEDKNNIISRYENRFSQFGYDIRTLAGGNREKEAIRFENLASAGRLGGTRILDIGCGFGDFYSFLKALRIDVDYTGYDLVPRLIKTAKVHHPEAVFEVRDIQTEGIDRRFDYIFASQVFNNRLIRDSNIDTVKDVLRIAYGSCNRGMAFDFLTSYVDYEEDHLFYYSPEEIFGIAKSLTKRVTLKHDYPLFEFTVYLYTMD